MAARPKTLWASISPVMLGTVFAFGDGVEHWPSAIACLLMALFAQIGSNFTNDYCDFINGADTEERIGPARVMQAGLLNFSQMQRGIVLVFFLSFLAGSFLMFRGGWPMGLACFASILSAILYTAGPYPLGYHGWGDVFVFLFFGPIAVGGTYYVQGLSFDLLPIVGGMTTGLLCTAILVVNNLRDMEGDAKVGKRTLAVRYGRNFARIEYLTCILLPCAFSVWMVYVEGRHPLILSSLLILPLAVPLIKTTWKCTDGPSLNEALVSTAKLLTVFTVLFSIGWLV